MKGKTFALGVIPELPHRWHIIRRPSRRRRGTEDLKPPIQDIRHENLVIIADSEKMRPGKLPRKMPRRTEGPEYLSMGIAFDDTVEPSIRHPDMAIRRQSEPIRLANILPFLLERAITGEHPDAAVRTVPHNHPACTIDDHGAGGINCPGPVP